MKINIGNSNKINNSIIGNNNNKELPNESSKSNIYKIVIDIIIGIVVGLIVGFVVYKLGWN